jgi:sugar/nucleoside kinase (ribokinase family)
MVNDSEARELSRDWNIHRAAAGSCGRAVARRDQAGEYGALLIEPQRTFYVPAFPLETVFDPTGAGDAFAGGFMAYLARTGSLTETTSAGHGVRRGDGLLRGGAVRHPRFEQVTSPTSSAGCAPSRISPTSSSPRRLP